MEPEREYCFGTFRLDPPNARLFCDQQTVALQPKAFDVLVYLVRHAGRLVTQDELLRAVWPDTIVGDSSLKSCIRQIRRTLGDDVGKPQFVETAHRRGYRFIAPLTAGIESPAPAALPMTVRLPAAEVGRVSLLVGRAPELQRLQGWLARARTGERQLAFITGSAGSGKSALAEVFLQHIAADPGVLVAGGQCFEQFGSGEAYRPVLEALDRVGRGPHRAQLTRVLADHAPTWLALLPGLRGAAGSDSPATGIAAARPERMLREMAEAVERLTTQATLVLVLEDLHWGDYSTLDLISALARRREPARLLVLSTYRPVDAVLSSHPLRAVKQDLQARGLCHELPLGPLSETAVAEFLAARFPRGRLPDGLARVLHQRTEGHPLFFVNLVDDWLAQGALAPRPDGAGWELKADLDALAVGVPASIRALIEKQIDRLGRDELRVLEGASAGGVEFAVAAAAAAVEEDVGRAEEYFEVLARRHNFLQPTGTAEWPDGTMSTRYRFGHELYHRVVSEGVSVARRRILHQRLGARLESAHRDGAPEIAGELAHHFEQARDAGRAVRYCGLAADRAGRQYAHREAIDYLRRALAAVEHLPASEGISAELRLQVNLGLQLQMTRGFAAEEARRAYARARDLCRRAGEGPLLFPVLWGLWLFHKVRAEIPTALAMADELFALAQRLGDPALVLQAHQAMAVTTLCAGDPAATRDHMDRGTVLYDPDRHHTHTFHFGQDPGVACRAFGAVALWLLGHPDQALRTSREASRLSHELTQPSSQALALHFSAMVHQCRREGPAALACAELALAIAAEQGHSFWLAGGTFMRGWAIADCGDGPAGIDLMRQGLDAWRDTGSVTYRSYYLALLAEALAADGRAADGLPLLDEGLTLVERTAERLFEAELHRLRGELLVAQSASGDEVEGCFRQALAVAGQQKATSLELRAATSLVRACRKRSRRAEARALLADTLNRFNEGFDTRDLLEAKSLLEGMKV